MKKLKIETGLENKVLRTKSKKVEKIDKSLLKLLEKMKQTMIKNNGIGLAAPQIGNNIRAFVMMFDTENKEGFEVEKRSEVKTDQGTKKKEKKFKLFSFINPEILEFSDEKNVFQEGCLSLPEKFADIERPAEILLKFSDEKGSDQKLKLKGLNARIAQHEYDHLEGVLFLDLIKMS